MSATITYKGAVLATASNNTKVLKTARKYMEDDVTIVDVSSGGGGGNMQTKSVSYTPTQSTQTQTVSADAGYDGLQAVNITVNPIPSNYGLITWDGAALTVS